MEMKRDAELRRYRALDGLRGFAAVLVVFLHIDWTNHITNNNFVENGYLAVDLFFILSGFVIAANYSNRINSLDDVGRFLLVRLFRLYPLHFVILGIFVAIECAKLVANISFGIPVGNQPPFTGHNSFEALLANLLLLHGLHLFAWPTWNGSSWSISCEVAAYFVFSFAFLYRLRKKKLYLIIGLLASSLSYLAIAIEYQTLDITADWGFVRCFAGFFLGTLIFDLSRTWPNLTGKLSGSLEIAVGLGLLVLMTLATGSVVVGIIPLFVLLIFSLQSDNGPVARLLMSRHAQFLGRISYSVYMVHELFVILILIVLKRTSFGSLIANPEGRITVFINPWIGDVLTVLVILSTIFAAAITYVYIEEPARLFGRRLVKFKGKAGAVLDDLEPNRDTVNEPDVCATPGSQKIVVR
jgi:peptidoglycan/LPS O-acetylase OafA/YrhL